MLIRGSGPAWSDEDVASLFTPFVVASAAPSELGPGLLDAFQIALAHGGDLLTHKSGPLGPGSSCACPWTRRRSAARSSMKRASPGRALTLTSEIKSDPLFPSTPGGGHEWKAMSTILVVDDQPQIQQMYRTVLRRSGYEVVVASNGFKALHAMESHFPDLILLDMAMPELDGVAFLQIIRQTPEWARIPVILITAFASEAKVELARLLGVVDHFVKADFSVKELRRRIELHLAQRPAKVVA